jgi:hypothetical protein
LEKEIELRIELELELELELEVELELELELKIYSPSIASAHVYHAHSGRRIVPGHYNVNATGAVDGGLAARILQLA